ncbi:39S ribosomal protein L18, mitochondrial [Nilaparvata lugens]|uniref:39S ribosomal protein L18, mitochondrial n=1 Tax=Nilaparvata lugens TaxID=108931 RepID=UPI00193EA583|nr:39S ribosomal protein L18, mitochondrial [Nilaparvata lugens]
MFPLMVKRFQTVLKFSNVHSLAIRPVNTDLKVNLTINNRNPRNLERMRIAIKPSGYHLDVAGRKQYWHKLVLLQSQRHAIASVVHNNGFTVVTASTSEWPIRKFLHQANDLSAYINLGRVLADRCLESGIHFMVCDVDLKESRSAKVKQFLENFEQGGVMLKEPEVFKPRDPWRKFHEQKPWTVGIE